MDDDAGIGYTGILRAMGLRVKDVVGLNDECECGTGDAEVDSIHKLALIRVKTKTEAHTFLKVNISVKNDEWEDNN